MHALPDLRTEATRPGPSLVFLHIPKTAGTALADALASTCGGDHARGYDRSLFGTFDDFAALAPPLRGEIVPSADAMPAARFVGGHFAFSTIRDAYPGAPTITVLRDGRSRLLSHWLYWRGTGEDELAPWGGWADRVRRSRGTLAEFLSDPLIACQTDNLATRMLLWPHPAVDPDRFIPPRLDRRLFRLALARLRRLGFVDVLENPDLEHRIGTWLGRPLAVRRENVTGSVPAALRTPLASQLDRDGMALLAARSRLDDRLWRHVAARRMRGTDVARLGAETLLRNVARYGTLIG